LGSAFAVLSVLAGGTLFAGGTDATILAVRSILASRPNSSNLTNSTASPCVP